MSFWSEDKAFSCKSDLWTTPKSLFAELNWKYKFTLDPCATDENALCDKYYTIKDNGLEQDWGGEIVFMNPPYNRTLCKWIEKAYKESLKGATVVCLIPARTDTRYWHNYIFPYASDIRFLKGRLKFGNGQNSAPFPSAIIEFRRIK